MTTDYTKPLLEMLEVLRKKEIAMKEPFKAKAYSTVAKNITMLGKPIHTMDDLKDVKGIGEKIGQKIQELFETGHVLAAEIAVNNEDTKVITSLMQIHGIGPAKAKSLVEDHNIKSIEELERKQELLNDKQKVGLKYVRDFQERIPRKEMDVHCNLLGKSIQAIDENFEFEVTGSYRRMLSSSGDIDILITHKNEPENVEQLFKKVIEALKKEGYITDVFAEGGKKCLAVCKLKRYKRYRRIDLLYTNKKEYPFAVLYFTGDATFNVNMRAYCMTKGLSLSEHGIKDDKTGEFIDIGATTEKDIFEYVGIEYVQPKDRNGAAIKPL
jgi:DNA polymerase/3'-5' exonuclease PolX